MLPVIRCDENLYSVPKFDLGKADIKDFMNELSGFHEQFADCFQRSESREHFFNYMAGQFSELERKSIEPIALAVKDGNVRAMQRFVSVAQWDDNNILSKYRSFVNDDFGSPDGALIFDESGFLKKAQDYVKANRSEPFFLYYALQQPHVPRTPSPRFVGSSGMGPRGDVILEADWCVGELINTLESEGLLDNTLIIFSSDNGPVLNDGYYDDAVEKLGDHRPAGPLRGGKYSLFEAGTRVPFITYWKGNIEPGISDAMVSQLDLLSSLAELVGSDEKGRDSDDLLDVFLGKSEKGRDQIVLEATSRTAFRQGDWAMIPPYGGPSVNKYVNIELGNDKEYQLYNLKEDIGQQKNLAQSNMEKLEEMIAAYKKIRGEGAEVVEEMELK
ncbi:hypothetical protein LCGC14_2592300 [marine sediment metagenome]|uniref:Sulfatase N-terminal domain-containing protein n=1 Tax=marine sediment metagenome TaxID=412755 RepID=A0A0F9CMD6_9ZZZZ